MKNQTPIPTYTLAHPLYLDVQMMVSFLAYLQGGVAFEGEETIRSEETRTQAGKASGKVKIPSIATWLGAEVSGDLAIDKKLDATSEYKTERHHTAASLFNYLYAHLGNGGQITSLNDEEDIRSLQTSQLVQASGRYIGNPLADILNFFGQLMPYLEDDKKEKEETPKRKNSRKSGNPAVRQNATALETEQTLAELATQAEEQLEAETGRLLSRMREDMNRSPVHDLVLATSGGLKVVLTVSSQYYSAETSERLRAGDFTVLGKATRILVSRN